MLKVTLSDYSVIYAKTMGEEVEQLDFHYGDYVYYEKDNIINMIKSGYHDHKYFEQLLEYVNDNFPNNADYTS